MKMKRFGAERLDLVEVLFNEKELRVLGEEKDDGGIIFTATRAMRMFVFDSNGMVRHRPVIAGSPVVQRIQEKYDIRAEWPADK